jgi:hypothetical protein
MGDKLPQSVAKALGYYVYLYVNPESGEVFYVGKGKGIRALSHLKKGSDSRVGKEIYRIRQRGLEPRVEILIHGLRDERAAFEVEMAAINLLGLDNLVNEVSGHHSAQQGRMSLEQIRSLYLRKQVRITDPVILIRVAKAFRYDMSDHDLYDITRTAWVVGGRREKAEYALAVYDGIVREVYKISQWLPAGSTFVNDKPRGNRHGERWEFVGVVADDQIRKKYRNRDVTKYFKQGSQNPVFYVNC